MILLTQDGPEERGPFPEKSQDNVRFNIILFPISEILYDSVYLETLNKF